MSEKNDIKYGQLWARHSELVSNSDVGNYRINFEGLKNAIDEALRDAQTGAVWVKASERFPGWRKPVRWRLGGIEKKVCDVYYLMQAESPAHISEYEWLDEAAPSGEREEDAVSFAEWLYDNFKGYDPMVEKWVYGDDEKRYTTAELYKLFKQNENP